MLKLEAPWYTYQKKVKALFGLDEDIDVGEVYNSDNCDYAFDIEVKDSDKFVALDRVLPKSVNFGNVELGIRLINTEDVSGTETAVELYQTIFKNNPILKDIRTVEDKTGGIHGFVRFQPEVIQFFHDDISDYNGNWSGLAQDIAKEVFANRNVHFCTADLRENGNSVCEPLGEWP